MIVGELREIADQALSTIVVDDGGVDLEKLELSGKVISELHELLRSVKDAVNVISSRLSAVEARRNSKLSEIEDRMELIRSTSPTVWRDPEGMKRVRHGAITSSSERTEWVKARIGREPTPVEDLSAVKSEGLYYIPEWDQFALQVGGVVLHGNIGKVHDSTRKVQKGVNIRSRRCQPTLCKGSNCTYFHDPSDISPARRMVVSRESFHRDFFGDPAFGFEALDETLLRLTPEEKRQIQDRLFHDILVMLIM